MKYIVLAPFLVCCLFFSTNDGAPTSKLGKLEEKKIDEFRQAGKIQGLQIAISEGPLAPITIKKFGTSSPGQAWAQSDLLRIASVSKSFLAALFFQVADAEHLRPSDTLERFFPAEILPNIDLKKLRIEHLLRHSSGIPDYFTPEFIQSILDKPGRVKTETDALGAVKHLPPEFEPGTSTVYSNTNYVLLGLILDAVAHKRGLQGHQELLRKEILQPAGLRGTFYEHKEARLYDAEKIVSGFLGSQDFLRVEQGYGLPNGGLLSNLSDVTHFFKLLFDPHGPLPLAAHMMPSETEAYGYGLYRIFPSSSFIGHTGEFAGYLSFVAHDPKNGITIAGFANGSTNEAKAQFKKLQEYLFSFFAK